MPVVHLSCCEKSQLDIYVQARQPSTFFLDFFEMSRLDQQAKDIQAILSASGLSMEEMANRVAIRPDT